MAFKKFWYIVGIWGHWSDLRIIYYVDRVELLNAFDPTKEPSNREVCEALEHFKQHSASVVWHAWGISTQADDRYTDVNRRLEAKNAYTYGAHEMIDRAVAEHRLRYEDEASRPDPEESVIQE